ncbi:hemerythrin domain-containing protein [Kitasatospora sp. NPDC048545]|uniref:hemerythrin domain-containing protein n=1 Tax=Kitasatospora sp. NPDC048545 TaxID=3157208 RepID=UPI0033CEADD4
MHHDQDLLEQLVADHRSVRVHFSELSGIPSGDKQRKQLVDLIVDQVVRHIQVEERHLYPLARERLADGRDVVERELADHRAVESLLEELRHTHVSSPHFDRPWWPVWPRRPPGTPARRRLGCSRPSGP